MRERYVAVFRRRRQGKTNYKRRKALVISRLPAVKPFISSRNVYVLLVTASAKGDETVASANSIQLSKYGWKGSRKSIPACYLTGFLLGKKALKGGHDDEAVLFTGLKAYRSGSRLAAIVKGAIDAGLKVRVDEETLPDEGRVHGGHISSYAKSLKDEDPDAYKSRFSAALKAGADPEETKSAVDSVKASIEKGGSKN